MAVDYVQSSNPNGNYPNQIENFLSYNDGPGMRDLRPNRVNPQDLFHKQNAQRAAGGMSNLIYQQQRGENQGRNNSFDANPRYSPPSLILA